MKGVFVQTAKLIRKRTCILPAVILAAMRGHSRTCLNKLRAAPLLRALASLHIFAHRPAAAAPAVLRSLARCLFILAAACLLTSCGPEPGEQDYENSLFGEGRPSAGMTAENSTGQESLKDRPAKEGSGKDKSTGSGSSSSGAESGGSRGAAEQE